MIVPQASLSLVTLFLLFTTVANAALRTFNFTLHSGLRAPDGFRREVYLINGQQPGPLIEVEEDDILEVTVKNDLDVENTIHWHGLFQRGSPQMDGTPGVTQYPIPPGGTYTYRFSTANQYGFYWYHSHVRAYYDDAIRGGLLIHPSPSRSRSFQSLARNATDVTKLLRAERKAVSILLNDWTHELSDTIYSQYFRTGAYPFCVDSILANGFGRVQCLPEAVLQAGTGLGISQTPVTATQATSTSMSSSAMTAMSSSTMAAMSSSTMAAMSSSTMAAMSSGTMAGMSSDAMAAMSSNTMAAMSSNAMASMPMSTGLSPRGCMPPDMFRPGYNSSSLPPDTCTNTTSPLLNILADSTDGWLALNLVNSGGVSMLRVSLDSHSMFVYMADGLYVDIQEANVIEMSIGQRYSVLIRLDQAPGSYALRYATYPTGDMQQVLEGHSIVTYSDNIIPAVGCQPDPSGVYMLVNGSAVAGASTLQAEKLAPFSGNTPPKTANLTKVFTINQTDITDWVVNKQPYSEAKTPILFDNSTILATDTTIPLPFNSTVDVIMTIANDSMDMVPALCYVVPDK
ncbi:MAG: hypothetical protein M1819_000567 [Sarea resinae]|nr:MAG: hypothetical protein M1819_000567 [Sarea resinae]